MRSGPMPCSVVLLLWALWVPAVRADEAAPVAEDGAAAAERRALVLLDEALTTVERTPDWTTAKQKLEEAQSLAQFPNIFFHLARAYFRLGETERGMAALARYEELADAHNPNRREAEQLRREHPTRRAPAGVEATSAGPRQTKGLPLGPLITVGVGGVSLIAALITGLLTRATNQELSRNCDSDEVCPDHLESVMDHGERLKLATNVLLGVGLGAVAAGTTWWLLANRRQVEARVACTDDGCRASTRVRF